MTLIIGVCRVFLNAIYAIFKCFPEKQRILMLSRQANTPSYEFKMIHDEVKKLDENVEVKYLCKTMGRSVDGKTYALLGQAVSYGISMLKQMYYLATSKVALLDSYIPAVSLLNHKKSLTIIQMWHSMGTMKLFGWAILGNEEGSSVKMAEAMRMHANYDYYFASSPAYQSHLARGFNCDERKAKIFPLPRYDLLTSKEYKEEKRKTIFKQYPQVKNNKIILYCPTFRKDETEMLNALENLCSSVPDDFYLIVKLHPLSKIHPSFTTKKNVLVDTTFSTMDMLFIADYVISDYSCVIYEAAILGIPLYFYNFDYGTYVGNRGFAIDYENELPGVISKDPQVILNAIQQNQYDKEELRNFANRYVVPRKHATRDIAEFLLGEM